MNIDLSFAKVMNDFLNWTNGSLTGILKAFTILGNAGIGFIIIAIILLLFKRTRRRAFYLLISFAIGFLMFELILKHIVQRPRPFWDESSIYYEYWTAAGSLKQSGYSFPSGHTTIALEFGLIMFLMSNKKYSWIYLFIPILMGITRTYFMVHYLTDVLGGLIAGSISVGIIYLIYYFIDDNKKLNYFFEMPNLFINRNKNNI